MFNSKEGIEVLHEKKLVEGEKFEKKPIVILKKNIIEEEILKVEPKYKKEILDSNTFDSSALIYQEAMKEHLKEVNIEKIVSEVNGETSISLNKRELEKIKVEMGGKNAIILDEEQLQAIDSEVMAKNSIKLNEEQLKIIELEVQYLSL